jgi:hypothetical protein
METQLNTFQHWADIHLTKDDADKFFINMANEVNANTPDMTVPEHEFIYSAFVWDRSNEGHFFWKNIQEDLEEKNGWEG